MSTNVHNFADSLTIGDIGTNLIQCMAGGQHFNEVTPTKSGGYEDKTLKTDLYIDDKPVQVKLDWQTMWTENACVELAQMTWMGGRMSRMRDGALLEEKLYQKDLTLMYILPGVGIAEWNPFRLNYAVWYWLTQWNHEDSFNYEGKEMKNTFRLVVANNKNWASISYLIPYPLMTNPTCVPTGYNFQEKRYEYSAQEIGPIRFIPWYDCLMDGRISGGENWDNLMTAVRRSSANYGHWKKQRIYNAWDMKLE